MISCGHQDEILEVDKYHWLGVQSPQGYTNPQLSVGPLPFRVGRKLTSVTGQEATLLEQTPVWFCWYKPQLGSAKLNPQMFEIK
ncbi:hypothetical protein Taro_002909 [Colocasia esculenta]|uniref:Uncharacterized protein n=1 Tax=Colocasia esculenta TaxID=4460 RepID=A0A843TFK2_COLES|nr:hypothetical protein [Colocasia esculenta]